MLIIATKHSLFITFTDECIILSALTLSVLNGCEQRCAVAVSLGRLAQSAAGKAGLGALFSRNASSAPSSNIVKQPTVFRG